MQAGIAGVAGILLGAAGTLQEPPGDRGALGPEERIVHVLSRLTPGPTRELVEEVRARGLDAWLHENLARERRPEPSWFEARLARLETLRLSGRELYERFLRPPAPNASPEENRQVRQRAALPARDTLEWVLLRAVSSANPVHEVAADFFRNHFSVSIDKNRVREFVADWEREILYKRASGPFGDLLEATAQHPCMLVYLDNFLSRRPATSGEAARIEALLGQKSFPPESPAPPPPPLLRSRGLNENYARELLELHTLGVDNFYTQKDVLQVALCLTGWTVGLRNGAPAFRFVPRWHAPGDKTFLGHTIAASPLDPLAEGKQVLRILREHPGTARFISWKLCRWLVHDSPDPAMVERVAETFRQSQGDLPRVLRAIVEDPLFFDPQNYRAKFKRPWEFVVSALRVTGAEIVRAEAVLKALESMGEPLYRCPAPTGYYDQAEAWQDPGSMAARWTFASDLAAGRLRGVRISSDLYRNLDPSRPETWKSTLAARILPGIPLGQETSRSIDRLIESEKASPLNLKPEKTGPRIVAILLGSPEFQKQ